MKTISYKLKDLDQKEKKVTLKLGYVGENEHVQIRIDCSEIWENYPNAVASLAVEPPEGSKYPAIVTREGNVVCWTVKDSDVVHDGDGRIQLTFTEGSEIQKTVICRTKVDESIIGSGTTPDPIADFVSEANEALAELEAAEVHGPVIGEDGYWYTWSKDAGEYVKTDTKAQGEDGQQGPAGKDGKDGKDGSDGAPGQDGHTPVKGTDYWTQQDQADIVAAAALETVSAVIDDTAGDGDTNKTWSADKIADVTGQLLNDIAQETADLTKVKDATITMTVEPSGQDVDISTQLTYENGKYVNKSGYVGLDNQYKCTNKIAVEEGEIYKTLNNYTTWRFVCAYNGDTPVEEKGAVGQQNYTVPTGITHIIITLYSDIQTNSKAVVKQSTTVVYHNSANALVEAEETARASADEAIEDVTITEKTLEKLIDISADQTYVMGQYINTSGYNGLDANYNRTEKIAVNPGETYKTLYKYSAWRYVCAYNGNTAVSDKGASNVYTYTVPEGITHIVLTLYNDLASLSDRVIAKVTSVTVKDNSAAPKIEPQFVKRKARVTFIDDDGYKEFATYMTPIMEEKGVPMCVAYMGDLCPTFKQGIYMTEAECKEVEDLGGEIVVHGGTNLTQFATVEEAEANVLASKNALEAHGFKSDVYVYPESGTNIELREMLAKYFKCAFKTGHPQKNDTRVNDKCVPHFFIHRCSAGGYYDDKSADYGNYDTYTMDYFEALIDDAVDRGGWLVFMTHAWMMPIGSTYRLEHDAASGIPDDLDEFALIGDIIDYILELKQGGTDIDIVTASEGFEIFKNEVQAGDYLGYWNETYTDLNTISRFWHDKAGFAVNKIGDIDFADDNRISHS